MTAGTDETDETNQTSAPAGPAAPAAAPPTTTPAPGRFLAALDRPGPAALLLLFFGVLLLLPGLGAFGLWDPHEVRLIEGASDPIELRELWMPEHAFKPRLPLMPLKLGAKLLGATELGARLPMAGLALLSLLALLHLGVVLKRVRAGALAALALLTMPVLFLSARQASLTLLPALAQILAVAGLVGLAWPRPERRVLDVGLGALVGALGLGLGLLSCGALVGVAAPAGAVALALALVDGPILGELLVSALFGASLIMPARVLLQLVQPTHKQQLLGAAALIGLGLGAAVLGRLRRGLWLGAVALGIGLCFRLPAGTPGYSPWVAGLAHWPPTREVQVDSLLKSIGFFLFPWSALLPLALSGLLGGTLRGVAATAGRDTADRDVVAGRRAALGAILPLAWFGTSYLLTTLQGAAVAEVGLVGVGALALALGLYLEALALDAERRGGVLAALCGALLLCAIGRDFFFQPEQYLSAQLAETLRWPGPLTGVAQILSTGALVLAAAFGLILALPRLRRLAVPAAVGLPLLTAFLTIHVLVPAVSRHVSYRGLFTRFKQLGGGQLGVYGVPQAGSKVYGQKSVPLYSLAELFDFLKKGKAGDGAGAGGAPSERPLAIVGASELAGIDQFAFQNKHSYHVVDDSNSQMLLLASELKPGEQDRNPLRRLVTTTPPQPRFPVSATFEDYVELFGYDLPAEVSRGDDIPVRLYFRVLKPLGGGYKVFMHFDGMGARFNGDHVPLDGKYPTPFWTAGQYIIDEHRVPTSRLNQAPGYYQVFTGLWPGGDGARLKVTQGAHEPDHRVRLGMVRLK
ncbi:MAG: hypothetical protein U1A78_16440 [Polyangia bacterium]